MPTKKKLKLKSLKVTSFLTSEESRQVKGQARSVNFLCEESTEVGCTGGDPTDACVTKVTNCGTCETCGDSCYGTCEASCNGTCVTCKPCTVSDAQLCYPCVL